MYRPLNLFDILVGLIKSYTFLENNPEASRIPVCLGNQAVTTTLSNTLLSDILQQIRPLIGQGKVADYIPARSSTC